MALSDFAAWLNSDLEKIYNAIISGGGGTTTGATTNTTSINDAASVEVLPSNTSRVGAILYNEGVNSVLIKFLGVCSVADYSKEMFQNETFVVPNWFKGRIEAICRSGETTNVHAIFG